VYVQVAHRRNRYFLGDLLSRFIYMSVFGNTGATALSLAVQEEFIFENSCGSVFTFTLAKFFYHLILNANQLF